MALSALSMAYKNHTHSTDALEHYQQVIPALKNTLQSTEDSFSDGALLSHYILLLYEVGHMLNFQAIWVVGCGVYIKFVLTQFSTRSWPTEKNIC